MKTPTTLYTLRRFKPLNTKYTLHHGSDDAETTICGLPITDQWYIEDNTFTGKITCPHCIKVLQEYPTIPQRINKC